MNTLYTPLFTPPLDTAVGKERKTVQLVEVSLDKEGNYTFDFARLQRFIKMLAILVFDILNFRI